MENNLYFTSILLHLSQFEHYFHLLLILVLINSTNLTNKFRMQPLDGAIWYQIVCVCVCVCVYACVQKGKDDILPILPNFLSCIQIKENGLLTIQITEYELYDLNFKEARQVLKTICYINWNKCVSIRNIRFSSEWKDSPFILYYHYEKQNKFILTDNNDFW